MSWCEWLFGKTDEQKRLDLLEKEIEDINIFRCQDTRDLQIRLKSVEDEMKLILAESEFLKEINKFEDKIPKLQAKFRKNKKMKLNWIEPKKAVSLIDVIEADQPKKKVGRPKKVKGDK